MLDPTQAKMAEPAENYNLLEKQSMKTFLVILLLLLQTGFAWARPKVADAGPEAALQSFIQAFDNLDWDRFRSFFADDATVFYPRGFPRRAQGRAEIEANFQQVFAPDSRRSDPASLHGPAADRSPPPALRRHGNRNLPS